jgi:hypothetical protein
LRFADAAGRAVAVFRQRIGGASAICDVEVAQRCRVTFGLKPYVGTTSSGETISLAFRSSSES